LAVPRADLFASIEQAQSKLEDREASHAQRLQQPRHFGGHEEESDIVAVACVIYDRVGVARAVYKSSMGASVLEKRRMRFRMRFSMVAVVSAVLHPLLRRHINTLGGRASPISLI